MYTSNSDTALCQHDTLDMDPDELAIQSAILDLEAGVYKSQRKAAVANKIARSTLQGRLQGRQSHAVAHQNQQRLTPEQEDFLVDWIRAEDLRAQPPSRLRVREMATRILHMNGDFEPLGQLWVPHFVARNPRIASIVSRSIEGARTTATSHDTIQTFLELSNCTRVELRMQYKDIWNRDETRASLGVRMKAQVLVRYRKKKAYIKPPRTASGYQSLRLS